MADDDLAAELEEIRELFGRRDELLDRMNAAPGLSEDFDTAQDELAAVQDELAVLSPEVGHAGSLRGRPMRPGNVASHTSNSASRPGRHKGTRLPFASSCQASGSGSLAGWRRIRCVNRSWLIPRLAATAAPPR